MASLDIITLDNFKEKMAPWDPDGENHLYALVDMGSNGIRFSITDLSPPHARFLRCVYRERAAISLFDALSESSSSSQGGALVFPAETIKRVAQTLARFRSIAVDAYGVPVRQIGVFATEAMRRAANASAMLEAIAEAAPDLAVQILAPEVETLFGAVGARSGFVDVDGLFLDLGGGSVQMTYMNTYDARKNPPGAPVTERYEIAAAQAGESLPFGAARLIKVLDSATPEVQAAESSRLRDGMRGAFDKLRTKFPTLEAKTSQSEPVTRSSTRDNQSTPDGDPAGLDIYLCGGGFRGYGSMLMHNDPIQPYPIPWIGAYEVPGSFFARTRDMLAVNASYPGKIFGMSRRRRSQFAAIVAVVDALVAAVPKIRSVTFCAGGNREGALMMKLPPRDRDACPLSLLSSAPLLQHIHTAPALAAASTQLVKEGCIIQDVLYALRSALPVANTRPPPATILSTQGLDAVFARRVWGGAGADDDANASAALHDAVIRDPGCPGLTHTARAILGLALCARWGGGLAPADLPLHKGLRALAGTEGKDVVFWTEYVGATAAVVARVVPGWPQRVDVVGESVRFQAAAEEGKKLRIDLQILVNPRAAQGLDLGDLEVEFKRVAKEWKDEKKLVVTAKYMDTPS